MRNEVAAAESSEESESDTDEPRGNNSSTGYSLVYITVSNAEAAHRIADGLVLASVAACVTVLPGTTSVYKSGGQAVRMGGEVMLMAKTRTSMVGKVTEYVRANQFPGISDLVAVEISTGDEQHLNWIGQLLPEEGAGER